MWRLHNFMEIILEGFQAKNLKTDGRRESADSEDK